MANPKYSSNAQLLKKRLIVGFAFSLWVGMISLIGTIAYCLITEKNIIDFMFGNIYRLLNGVLFIGIAFVLGAFCAGPESTDND